MEYNPVEQEQSKESTTRNPLSAQPSTGNVVVAPLSNYIDLSTRLLEMEMWFTELNLGLSADQIAYLLKEEFDLDAIAALSCEELVKQLEDVSKTKLKAGPIAKLLAAHSRLVQGKGRPFFLAIPLVFALAGCYLCAIFE